VQVADGRQLAGQHDTYHSNQPLAYGCDPAENVLFIGCHDNECIFDQVVMRVGRQAGPDGIARVSGLCLALVTLGQGVPFIHAGDDLLRSKSLDRDSYNSGEGQQKQGGKAARQRGREGGTAGACTFVSRALGATHTPARARDTPHTRV
jgi:hypothetical protein